MATDLVDPMESVRAYLAAEKSEGTRRGYASDWSDFTRWCVDVNETVLPANPLSVAKYLAQLADRVRKASTIERRVAAIRHAHKAAGLEPPTNRVAHRAVEDRPGRQGSGDPDPERRKAAAGGCA